MYTCVCGKSFEKKQSFCAHCSHCEIRKGFKPKPRGSNIADWMKSNPEDAKRSGLYATECSVNKRLISNWNSSSEESNIKRSISSRLSYINGRSPSIKIGGGKGSYFNDLYLRSTWEALYTVYTHHNNIEFEYESVRVIFNNKLFISDFYMPEFNKVIEVKAIKGRNNLDVIVEAFTSHGYSIDIIGKSEIDSLSSDLRNLGYDIFELFRRIKSGYDRGDILKWTISDGEIVFIN